MPQRLSQPAIAEHLISLSQMQQSREGGSRTREAEPVPTDLELVVTSLELADWAGSVGVGDSHMTIVWGWPSRLLFGAFRAIYRSGMKPGLAASQGVRRDSGSSPDGLFESGWGCVFVFSVVSGAGVVCS